MSEPITAYLLPALISKLKSDSTDVRFLGLKIFTDMITQYLNDSTIYPTIDQAETPMSSRINDLIVK